MSQSLSALERGNPPPRRKSCAACIRSKRRCDLRQPTCLRCSQRRIDCSYPTQTAADRAVSSESDPTTPLAQASTPEFVSDVSSWPTSEFDFSMDLEQSCTSTCPTFPTISFEQQNMTGLEILDDNVDSGDILSLTPTWPEVDKSTPPELLRHPAPSAVSATRLRTFANTSMLVEHHFRYAIDQFMGIPERMLLENGTPWSHSMLYRDSMPASVQDAVAACALHQAKTSVNTLVLQRVIQAKYHALLITPIPTFSPRELLAHTHGLLIYQIILFFDISHAARAEAEETSATLTDAAFALAQHAKYDSEMATGRAGLEEERSVTTRAAREIPLYPLAIARARFEDWTFQESLRRTVMMSFFYLQIQQFMVASPLRLGTPARMPGPDCTACDPRLGLCQAFTLSAHLWKAKDAIDFAMAWRSKRHLVATPNNFQELLEEVEGDDVEEFGKMLVSTALGVEETRAWLVSKGGTL